MVTMYKKDRKFRKWKWNVSPSRFFDVFVTDANGGRDYVNTFSKRESARACKSRIEEDGGAAIIIGRA